MSTCDHCQTEFDVDSARTEYNSEFNGELDYDEDYAGEVCASCAISQSQSNINVGSAMRMMNGDEDYDESHVEKYL